MTVLRSHKIPAVPAEPRPKRSDIQPSTPSRTQEPNVHWSPVEPASDLPLDGSGPVDGATKNSRRRSLRIAYQCGGGECLNELTEKEVSISACGKRRPKVERSLSLRSGKRVAVDNGGSDGVEIDSNLDFDGELDVNLSKMSDRENKRKKVVHVSTGDTAISMANEEKGKTVNKDRSANGMVGDSLLENCTQVENENKNKEKGVMEDSYEENDVQVKCIESHEKPSSSMGVRKYTWEEKGKGIQVENVSFPITSEISGVGLEEMEIENSINNHKLPDAFGTELSDMLNAEQTQSHNSDEIGNDIRTRHFRDIAKKNASKFAHFDAEMEEEEDLSDREVEQQVEDWPGPFSTAMKIIKDREENSFLYDGTPVSYKERSSPIIWAPRRNSSYAPLRAPSLQELSLRVLVRNADAITSLDYVPDALRVKLCQLLCNSRRMDVHFLDLLVRGSPTEICVPDCSWLTEEQFTECFKNCDTSNLMVLQLDQCGRCMPDYVLHLTLARSPKNLPMLSSLSLSGACRLSDVGLQALVSTAPGIRSINLSQCSLLTSASIDMLSDSLGSVLRELYINECQNIDLKLILSALKKFEKLEVLSLVDLPSVRDRLLREFVTASGQALKQLILTNSVKLTDSCVKVISENCPNLSVLDLANVCKLTDSALGYLANGCQALEKLIFCRNSFSDEAVAAFVETSGGSLKELSLNNVKKVGHNTASALAKHSEKLQILDVSWCRDMSDDSLGYIVDNCSSLKVLKLFGCTQITDVFVRGHSNPNVKILGLKMDPFLDHLTKSLLADS